MTLIDPAKGCTRDHLLDKIRENPFFLPVSSPNTGGDTPLKPLQEPRMPQFGRHIGLWSLFGLQAGCAAFFLFDVVLDVTGLEASLPFADSDGLEYAVVAALVLGLIFTGVEIRHMLRRQKRMESQLRVASGAFADLLEEHFDEWLLTPSERDVALLSIKGLSIAEISKLRNTKDGTTKAQCNAIYRKAGVTGRNQLLSLFIEEMMENGVLSEKTAAKPEH